MLEVLSLFSRIYLGAWGAQPPAMTSSLTAAATNSARSSPWESPSHGFGNNTAVSAVVFDDEFDVIGARSRSPGLTGAPGLPPAVPPRRPLTGIYSKEIYFVFHLSNAGTNKSCVFFIFNVPTALLCIEDICIMSRVCFS